MVLMDSIVFHKDTEFLCPYKISTDAIQYRYGSFIFYLLSVNNLVYYLSLRGHNQMCFSSAKRSRKVIIIPA